MTKKEHLHKTYVSKEVKHFISKDTEGYDFILSDASVDRYGDIIQTEGWQLDNFRKNPIALFNHNPNFVIGSWENLAVKNDALGGTLKLAPHGTSDRIDEIRRLIDVGILRAVSVGFSPIAYKEYQDEKNYGFIYEKSELVETSLVSVPANPNALLQVKELNISAETQDVLFGKHADLRATLARRGNIEKAKIVAAQKQYSFLEREDFEEQRRRLRYQIDELTRCGAHWRDPRIVKLENRIKSLG